MPDMKRVTSHLGDELIQDWLKLFSSYSIQNDMYAKISLHVILGQLICGEVKEIGALDDVTFRIENGVYYRMGSRKIDSRIHLLLIKPQATGKGAGYTAVARASGALGINFQKLTEATDAGLVGTVNPEAESEDDSIIDGLLKTADIVGMEEASVLFDLTSEFSKKNMTYFQIMMNSIYDDSNEISKKLGGRTIRLKPHGSCLLMSYPPDRLVDKIVKTGFIDRLVTIFEDVTLEDRLDVIKKMSDNINVSTDESYKKDFDFIVERLEYIKKQYSKVETNITITDDIRKLILQVIDEFAMKILDASPKAREKLERFVSRLFEILVKLAVHHAIISNRTNLEVADVAYSRLTYLPIWKNLIISLESLLIIDPVEMQRRYKTIRTSIAEYNKQIEKGKFVKGGVWVRRLTMIENLQFKWDQCSMETADFNLRKIEKTQQTKYNKYNVGIVRRLQKDKFFERRNIGGFEYVKKIKDIVV